MSWEFKAQGIWGKRCSHFFFLRFASMPGWIHTFATKETSITIMEFNTIQRTRQRLGCTSNLPSIKKNCKYWWRELQAFFLMCMGQGYQRNLTSIKTCGLSFKLLPKEVGRGIGNSGLYKKHKSLQMRCNACCCCGQNIMACNIASQAILHPKKIQQAFTCQKSSKHQLSTLSSKSEGFGTPMTWMWVSP